MTSIFNPGAHWEPASTAGWSVELLARAQAHAERIGSTAIMIAQRGRVVAQWGDVARKSPTNSISQSLLSALYGIAAEEGKIKLHATLAELGIDDKQPLTNEEKQTPVIALLTTRSYIYHPVDREPAALAGPRPPRGSYGDGIYSYYNNWDFNVLGTIYEQQTGEGIYESFKRRIADPIGMEDFVVSDGVWGPGEISNHRSYGFNMSARDLARFGRLYARWGEWDDQRILSSRWIHDSTHTSAAVRSLAFAGRGYGYMWWTHFGGDFAPGMKVPDGMFFAFGIGAQYLFVLPGHGLEVVHTVDTAREQWPEIDNRQIAHLLWLILAASGIKNIGTEPPGP